MAKDPDDIELDDDIPSDESNDEDTQVIEGSRNSLTKRRIIDNLLEERRLKKQLSDFDFDL